jgi:CO/xanthine dehydrogenase FAD-binding subunit
VTASVRAASPRSLAEAVAILAERPDLRPVAGGTDVMVGVNAGVTDVTGWMSLRHVAEFRRLALDGNAGLIGAGTTFDELERAAADIRPSLSTASRTVGSPQIRRAGTIGGNVVTASPAADSVPSLLCHDAEVELVSVRGERRIPLLGFATGPKRTVRAPDELVTAVHLGPTGGVESFAKVGTRNAMVISVCSLAARLDPSTGLARVAIGSVAPIVVRVFGAEQALLDAHGADEFAAQVVAAAAPIDDVRATAAYRRHALGVIARRTHAWLWRELDEGRAA